MTKIYEPNPDKTNKMACVPSEVSDQPGRPPRLIRVFAVHSVAKDLSFLHADRNASSTFHVFSTFMYHTYMYFLSLYPFAVAKPGFLYKTASLQ